MKSIIKPFSTIKKPHGYTQISVHLRWDDKMTSSPIMGALPYQSQICITGPSPPVILPAALSPAHQGRRESEK